MAQSNRTFRIFVSSTFTDMRIERGILQTDVFPKLKKFCEERGSLFQAIDLRWGVNEESQREQKTMEICLNEIARCQRLSPRPNFIVLLGDRYGWQPIPEKIPAAEMADIHGHLSADEKKLIAQWYQEDTNAVPSEYVLQPRGEEYRDYESWQVVEDHLREILRKAVNKTSFSAGQRTKYFASATHQEIINGAMIPSATGVDPAEHVFAYLRTIDNLPQDKTAGDFIDLMPDGTLDLYAQGQREGLKEELEKELPKEHVYKYHSQWNGGVQFDEKTFSDRVYDNFRSVIEKELQQITATDERTKEKKIHAGFRDRLIEFFTGQEDTLRYISSYLQKVSNKPLALIGPSGSGKSSIMAQAIHAIHALTKGGEEGFSVFRFIGVTSASSNLNSLLTQVCEEIARAYQVELKSLLKEGETEEQLATYEGLREIFARCVNLASEEKPLLIFLDALDQLQTPKYDFLKLELPVHARILVSALPELKDKLTFADIFMLPLMEEATGQELLDKWLLSEKRSLTRAQRQELIGKFSKNGLPIYLKLAFEQMRQWHSYDKPKALPEDVEGILAGFFNLLEKAHTAELVSRSIGYLLSGKYGGLTEAEVLDILAFDNGYWQGFLKSCHPAHRAEVEKVHKLPVVVWSRLFLDLEPYLTERDADGIKIMTFYHRAFNAYARKRYALYYTTLADYFEKDQPLYVNDKEKIPNIRKVVEQPYQQTFAEKWDALEKTLTDLSFIEAKCKARMVFELASDYGLALAALPENQEKVRAEREREACVKRWTTGMIAYAQAWSKRRDQRARGEPISASEPELPLPIPSCRRWTDQEIEAECQRILEHPNRLDRLTAFEGFVRSQCYPLLDHGKRPGIIPQHAFNYAPTGPVHDAAHELLRGVSTPLLLRRWPPGANTNPKPALLRTLERYSYGGVWRVSITPDGKRAVSWSWDKTLQVWDLESGKCLRTLENLFSVDGLCVTPDGRWAVSGVSEDNTLRVWDLYSGECLSTLEGHSDNITSVSVTPDGRRAVSGSKDKTLRVWDLESGECLCILEGHSDNITSVSVTPDGRSAISWSDEEIKIWDLEKGKCLRTLGYSSGIWSVSVSLDGRRAVSWSWDKMLRIWDLENGKCLKTLEHSAEIWSVSITPDGRMAVSGSNDKMLRVWDLEGGICVSTLAGHSDRIISVSITPDGKRAVSGSDDGTLRVWDIESGICHGNLEKHNDEVTSLSVMSDRKYVVSGSQDGMLRIWDLENGKCLKTLKDHSEKSEDESEWSELYLDIVETRIDAVRSVSVTPDSRFVVSGNDDETLRVWDFASGECLSKLEGHSDRITSVSITPDGRLAVSGSCDKMLRVWDLESEKCLRIMEEDSGDEVRSVSVTPDYRRVVSGSDAGTLRVRDLKSGKCLNTLEGHGEGIGSVSVTHDGKFAVSGSWDKTLRVWDLESGKCLNILEGHSGGINSVCVTPDGRLAFSGSGDKTLRVWDLENGTCLGIFVSDTPILSVAMVSHLILSGTQTGEVLFLELRNLILDRPVITAVRLWLFDQHAWDANITAGCPWCGKLFSPDRIVLDMITKYTSKLATDQSPCLTLPAEVWDDPHLLSECPHCHKYLRFNPFIVDNRDSQ